MAMARPETSLKAGISKSSPKTNPRSGQSSPASLEALADQAETKLSFKFSMAQLAEVGITSIQ